MQLFLYSALRTERFAVDLRDSEHHDLGELDDLLLNRQVKLFIP